MGLDDDANEVGIKEAFNFYYADLLLEWQAIDCSPFLLSFQGGIQYTHLKFIEDATSLFDQILTSTI